MEWVADESRRTRAPEAALAVVALRVLAARRPRALVHVVAPGGAVRVARVPFRTLAVVTAREVRAQGPGPAGVRQTALVHVHALQPGNKNKNKTKKLKLKSKTKPTV